MLTERVPRRPDAEDDPIVAILCSDIHLSHKRPVARADDWYEVQARYLRQLYETTPDWSTPIICAGDVFDRWNSPPELVNFAIDHLPEMHAVYGQHDLPNHCREDLGKSAFATLEKFGRIRQIRPGKPTVLHDKRLTLYGFPWGRRVKPLASPVPKDEPGWIHLAVIHSYIWTRRTGYEGAPKEFRLGAWERRIKGYSAAIFGDNHRGFAAVAPSSCRILNCGTFFRRKADEIGYKPCIGLLHRSGRITRRLLDTSLDRFADVGEVAKVMGSDASDFIAELERLGDQGLDFEEAVRRHLESNEISQPVKELVLKAIGDKGGRP